jgi:nucleotide-binding universal stress UspA family protein
MSGWTRILAAVQVDSSSAEVLVQVGLLAHWSGAEVHLIHVFETPGYGGPVELVPTAGRVATEGLDHWRSAKAMAAMMNDLLLGGARVIKGHMRHGVVEDQLLGMAAQGAFDLLVIGNHHPSRLERTFSGDLAGVLLNRCPCPLLVVPHA